MAVKAQAQQTLIDITDAYSVILTSEAYTFIGDTAYALAGSCTTQAVAYLASNSVLVTVGTMTCPTGITATVANNGTATPTITITVAAGTVSEPCEVEIPLTVNNDVQFTKKFSVGVALKGTTGDTGASGTSATWYTGTGITGTSTTATIFSDSGVASANIGDMYLNISTSNTYHCTVAGVATSAKWVYVSNIKGDTGSTGTSSVWYTGTTITGTATTSTVFSDSGITSAHVGDMYLNTSTWNTYLCTLAGNASTATWSYQTNIKGIQGDTGASGVDALNLVVTSSNGLIFKNTDIATTLVAHVYQGGVELTEEEINTIGTINWYKDGSSTADSTGITKTISAGDITNKADYVASLEG